MRTAAGVVAVVVVVACGKGTGPTTQRTPALPEAPPPRPEPSTTEAADALWALAPADSTAGVIVTGRGLVLLDRARAAILAAVHGTPDAEVGARLDEAAIELLGTADAPARAGIALDRGLAAFDTPRGWVVVLPVVDRARYVAATGGTRAGALDRVRGRTCGPVGDRYACGPDAAAPPALGGGHLGRAAGVDGRRGELELVYPVPPQEFIVPSGPASVVATIVRGELVTHARLPGAIQPPLDRWIGLPRATIDLDHVAGFVIVPTGGIPFVPRPLVKGVTFADLVGSFAGPLVATAPAGTSYLEVRARLRDPAPFQRLIAACAELSRASIPAVARPGACRIGPVPGLDLTGDIWVEGSELRAAADKGATPTGAAIPPTATGRELAGYTAAFWGRGSGFRFAGMVPGLAPGFPLVSELGLGIRFDADGLRALIAIRTIHANSPAATAELEAGIPSGADGAKLAADVARRHPSDPVATDAAAGPLGLSLPVQSFGIIAAIAIPAYLAYLKGERRPEPERALDRLGKNATAYRIARGKFPVGKAGPTPKRSCCENKRTLMCRGADPAWARDRVWSALEFAMEEDHRFRYSYQSDGKTFSATAVADLDCDGAGVTRFTLTGKIGADGTPVVELTRAPGAD